MKRRHVKKWFHTFAALVLGAFVIYGSVVAGEAQPAKAKAKTGKASPRGKTAKAKRPVPPYDKERVAFEEFYFTNPTSGARLWGCLAYPKDAGAEKKYPVIVSIPGGLGFSSENPGSGGYFASNGFVVGVFDPDGRGKSEGEENFNGMIQQDGLQAFLKEILSRDFVQADNFGFSTGSYGVALAAGFLARHPSDPPVKFFVDMEGPTDRHYITVNDTPRFYEGIFQGHSSSEVEWWREREAVKWAPQFLCRYIRIQKVSDHVHKDNKQHAIDIINAATSKKYGGQGISPWTRVNGPEDNEPNRVYTPDDPPKWLGNVARLDVLKLQVSLFHEMVEMSPLEVDETVPVSP